jgi:large subunit ribosomal protein L25
MERIELKAQSRTLLGKQVRQQRAQGWIPAVVYGRLVTPKPILAPERELYAALKQAGTTSLIELFLDEAAKPDLVLAREIQRNPLNGHLLHVDFYQVRLTEKVKTSPRLEFVGEPPMVRSGKGVLLHNMTEIQVECLPTDLISVIRVDVSHLETMEDNIVLSDPQDVVAAIVPTRAASEETEGPAAPAAAAPAPAGDKAPAKA